MDPRYSKLIFVSYAKSLFQSLRSSAVFGAFFFIGTFAFGVLRAYIPKFALVSIFGSIVLDIVGKYSLYLNYANTLA